MNLSGAIDEIESQRSFQFSLFENIVHKEPLREMDMPALVELMRGDGLKPIIEKLRASTGEEYKRIKRSEIPCSRNLRQLFGLLIRQKNRNF